MKEIITIQVGDFANYVGSHFWNFQDELLGLAEDPDADPIFKNTFLDMDVLYRAGETHQGIFTYCPRLISIGPQGSLGSMSLSGSLYGNVSSVDPMQAITWTGKVARSIAAPHKRNLFLQGLSEEQESSGALAKSPNGEGHNPRKIQDKDRVECLENDVNFWTDYSKVQFHPKSLYELSGSWTDFSKFDNYGMGKDVASEGSCTEEMSERLRYFIEECDHIQGIQFIVDDSGGFSSVAVEYLEHIADEYTNTPVFLYRVRAPPVHGRATNRQQSVTRALHDAVSFSKLSSLCNLMVPVGLPSLNRSKFSPLLCVNDEKLFHGSAVYAASIHSVSVPFHLGLVGPSTDSSYASGALDIGEIIHILAGQGRQNMVTTLDLAMPGPSITDMSRQGHMQRSFHPLTPEIGEEDEDPHAIESIMIHGTLGSGGHRASISQVKNSICATYEGGLRQPRTSHLSVSQCPLPIPLPFPPIFASSIGRHGEILSDESKENQQKGSLEIISLPMATRLRSSSAVMPLIQKQSTNFHKYGMARGAPGAPLLQDWGFGKDEIQDMGEQLSRLLQPFVPPHDMTSDSD